MAEWFKRRFLTPVPTEATTTLPWENEPAKEIEIDREAPEAQHLSESFEDEAPVLETEEEPEPPKKKRGRPKKVPETA